MRICIIAGNYPSEGNPKHVFLEKIVKEFVDQGNECVVIAPQTGSVRKPHRERKAVYRTDHGKPYMVYSPIYRGYSGRKVGFVHLGVLTHRSFLRAADRVYREEKLDCDAFYAHFINAGIAAYSMAEKYHKPFFIANGESSLKEFIDTLPEEKVREAYRRVAGIISVSTANKEEVLSSGYFPVERKEIIHVLPNGVDRNLFHKTDKGTARAKLGIDPRLFVVIFVGQFSERKGSRRLSEALSKCEDVWSVFIGSGPAEPDHAKCVFKGKVKNSEIPDYLNAADVFVLPTRNEGCCNAIIEASSCGLPVISSDLPFNYDILDSSCAILVDPENTEEIADAIRRLQSDPALREKLSEGALRKAAPFMIDERASRIIEIMKDALTDTGSGNQ